MSTNPPTGNLVKFWPSGQEMTLKDRLLFNAVNDHDQAITLLKSQMDAAVETVTTTINNNTTTGSTPSPPSTNPFPFLGTVNDQRGNTSYLTQLSDNGAKIIVGDASTITVSLNAMVTPPWFAVIDNDSTAGATLSPTAGSVIGESSIPAGGFGIVYYDGSNWFSGATSIATASMPGYVQPDNVSIGISAGVISTIGGTGTIHLGPITDSGATGQINIQDGLILSFVNPT